MAFSVLGVVVAYYGAKTQEQKEDQSLKAQQTYNYIQLWNSDVMVRERRILARSLLDFDENKIAQPRGGPATCTHLDKLSPDDLKPLYQGPNPFPQPSKSPEFSAFEMVIPFPVD